MYSAQAQLADAYLDAGRGLEARIISEDLVAREPSDRANIDRFRRALEMLGEADPDAVIADRLSGDSPFMATDKMDLNEGITFDDPIDLESAVTAPPLVEIDLTAALDAAASEKTSKTAKGRGSARKDRGRAGRRGPGLGATAAGPDVSRHGHDRRCDPVAGARGPCVAAALRGGLDAGTPAGRSRQSRRRARLVREGAPKLPRPRWKLDAPCCTISPTCSKDQGDTARALAVFGELDADTRGFRDVPARIARLSRAQVRE